MPDTKGLQIAEYSYYLPEEKIALYPLPQRDAARLLVYKNGRIEESTFTNLVQYLPELEDEGEIYESLEDIWPDYPSQDDFFFNEDEY